MNKPESPQVQAIKERYRLSFSEKIDFLKTLLLSLNNGVDNFVEIHESLHKLAGSSGMYGYDDISALCRQSMENSTAQDPVEVAENLRDIIMLLEHYCQS